MENKVDKIDYLVDCVRNSIPVVYFKFGDGEYLCSVKYTQNIQSTKNCDNDTYTPKLSYGLKNSLIYLLTNCNNLFIGKWYTPDVITYCENLTNYKINWIDYHTMIFEENDVFNNNHFNHKIKLYNEIKCSNKKKIMVCNELLIKTKILLNIDELVIIPFNNWFDNEFERVIKEIQRLLSNYNNEQCIILTACGMGAKVLISELYKEYPNNIYLDVGSGLDFICTKRNSRGFRFKYNDIYDKFKSHNMIPHDWDDDKYNYIYDIAKYKLGTHLPKNID